MYVTLENFTKIFPTSECGVKESEIIECYGIRAFQECCNNNCAFILGNNFFLEEIDEYVCAVQAICVNNEFIAIDFPIESLHCQGDTFMYVSGAANTILMVGEDFSYNIESKELFIYGRKNND